MRRYFLLLSLLVVSLVIDQASAETLVQWTTEQRLYVWLKVNQTEAQRFLPAQWEVTPAPSGPTRGANFLVGFLDQTLTLDGQGKPMGSGTGRGVVFGAPAKNKDTGEAGFFVTRIFGSGGAFMPPGAYKNTLPATVRFERSQTGNDGEPPATLEWWSVKPEGGGSLEFRVQYRAASPQRVKAEVKVYSSVEPTFFRIYRVEQGLDVARSIPDGVDRVQVFQLRVAVPELAKLFDGTEQVVGVLALPFYLRNVYLP